MPHQEFGEISFMLHFACQIIIAGTDMHGIQCFRIAGRIISFPIKFICKEDTVVSHMFNAITGDVCVTAECKTIANIAEDFPMKFSPSSLPRTTFRPFLNTILERICPCSLNTGEYNSTSMNIPPPFISHINRSQCVQTIHHT